MFSFQLAFFVVAVSPLTPYPPTPISHLKNLFLAHLKVARIVRGPQCSRILVHVLRR